AILIHIEVTLLSTGTNSNCTATSWALVSIPTPAQPLWTLSFCGTRQFHVVNENKNWTDAQKHCREKYTDLATIESQEEMNALVAVLNEKTGHFWIGLRQKENKDNTCWTWSDGSNFSYSNWNSGEPNNAGTGNCGELRSADKYR
uniref:C-type lectin domain-containing protein n=1 Tax=Pygocentrus nattereri TaxID=42514 RepID=A0A3B4CMU0_PYGNA